MAADAAVMVIDGSKGVEAQTRKLFKVCAMRHIPIFTFVNKMDRDAKDPFDLLDELERELGIETYAMNWPIGSGKEFQGVYDRHNGQLLFFSGVSGKNRADKLEIKLADPKVGDMIGQARHEQLMEEIELLGGGPGIFHGRGPGRQPEPGVLRLRADEFRRRAVFGGIPAPDPPAPGKNRRLRDDRRLPAGVFRLRL